MSASGRLPTPGKFRGELDQSFGVLFLVLSQIGRQGVKIEHAYADGRGWAFNGGDVLLRVFYGDGSWEAWIKRPEVPRFHAYGSQQETGWSSAEDILRER